MNDVASSSSLSTTGRATTVNDAIASETPPTAAELAERRKKNRSMFNRKRGELLDDLLRNLDILVYAELSTIYYMDCSFLRFLFRAFVQFVFLTLKQQATVSEQVARRPVLTPLVSSNLICLLMHLYQYPPAAGEATRGYLHGGLAMDFIGQKGPTSKVHLVLLDLLVLGLQLTHMATGMARKRARDAVSAAGPASAGSNQTPAATGTAPSVQDIDSEERGEHRADIEMQTLNSSGSSANQPDPSDPLLASTAPRSDAQIFDAFHSGQIVLADLELWRSMREQWHMVKEMRANGDPIDSQTRTQSLRAELASTLLRMRVGTDAIRESI